MEKVTEFVQLPSEIKEKIAEHYLLGENVPPQLKRTSDVLPYIIGTKEEILEEEELRDRYRDPETTDEERQQIIFDQDLIDDLRGELNDMERVIKKLQNARIITSG